MWPPFSESARRIMTQAWCKIWRYRFSNCCLLKPLLCLPKNSKTCGSGAHCLDDRYPMPSLTTMESMDSVSHLRQSASKVIRYIVRKTESYYRTFDEPTLVLILKVSVDVAAERRPEDNRDGLRERIEQVNRIIERENYVFIDADHSLENTVVMAKRAVWKWL